MKADEQISIPLPGDLRAVGQGNEIVAVARERDLETGTGQQIAQVARQQQSELLFHPAALLVAGVFPAMAGVHADAQDGNTDRVPGGKQQRVHRRLEIQPGNEHLAMAENNGSGKIDRHIVDLRLVGIHREHELRSRGGQPHFLNFSGTEYLKMRGGGPVGQSNVIDAEERHALQFAERALRGHRQQTGEPHKRRSRQFHERAQSARLDGAIQGKCRREGEFANFRVENR